jgi:hypothetical protein
MLSVNQRLRSKNLKSHHCIIRVRGQDLKTIGFKDNGEYLAKINEIAKLLTLSSDSTSDLLKAIIDHVSKSLTFTIQSTKQVTAESDQSPADDPEIKCVNRIYFRKDHWCVNKPPRMVKLETLDICRVCKQRHIGLTSNSLVNQRTKVEVSQTISGHSTAEASAKLQAILGQHYCYNGGLFVNQSACVACRSTKYHIFSSCPYSQKALTPQQLGEEWEKKHGGG